MTAVNREHAEQVPYLSEPQAQGDILILPQQPPASVNWVEVPPAGLDIIASDVTGHKHTLLPDAHGSLWSAQSDGNIIGYLKVPEHRSALLLHTDEHTPTGIAAGCYVLHRKRQADMTVRRPPVYSPYFHDDWDDDGHALVDD